MLEDVIGPREAALDVAEAQFLVIVLFIIDERVLGIGLVDHRCAGLQGGLDVEHGGERLVVDPHLCHRLIGLARAIGDHGDDWLALVANLVDRKRWLVVLAEIDQTEQRIEIARHVGAADEHALQLVVIKIGRGARDMAEHVLPLGRLTDFLQVIVALVGENVLAQFQHRLLL